MNKLQASMKAVVVREYGVPERFGIEDLPVPEPKAGEVRVRLRAAAVNYVDPLIAAGQYQVKPPLPFTPGSEFAGTVDALGAGVDTLDIGDSVCGGCFTGAYAEYLCVPAQALMRLPTSSPMEEAALLPVAYGTALYALLQRGKLRSGETVLVLGASGGIGYAAVQIASALGARVIAAASSESGREVALAGGADHAIDSTGDLKAQLRAIDGMRDVDIVFDPVGGKATEAAFRMVAWEGRHLVIGFVAGLTALPTHLALLKNASLVGVDLRRMSELEPRLHAENAARIVDLYAAGKLRPRISHRYPLSDFAAAMRLAGQRQTAGRIVLTTS